MGTTTRRPRKARHEDGPLELYFEDIRAHVAALSTDESAQVALAQFRAGWNRLPPAGGAALRDLYAKLRIPDKWFPADPRAIRIRGRLTDAAGDGVPDGMIETWQANAAGRYRHPADDREEPPLEDGFLGFGRSGTEDDGRFEIVKQPDQEFYGLLAFDKDAVPFKVR